MKKLTLIALILSLVIGVKAQNDTSKPAPAVEDLRTAEPNTNNKTDEIFPQFQGGPEAYKKFIKDNFKLPSNTENIHGLIIITFFVETDGTLTGIFVNRGLTPEIDKEALRVITKSPKWVPDMQHGKPVRVKYSVPIKVHTSEYIFK